MKAKEITYCDDCAKELRLEETVLMGYDTVCMDCAKLDTDFTDDYIIDIIEERDINDYIN